MRSELEFTPSGFLDPISCISRTVHPSNVAVQNLHCPLPLSFFLELPFFLPLVSLSFLRHSSHCVRPKPGRQRIFSAFCG